MVLLSLSLAILALVVSLVIMAASVELYRGLRMTQEYIGISDTPRILNEVTATVLGHQPSSYGLPPKLDNQSRAYVLFLTPQCTTCRGIVEKFDETLPDELSLVVTSTNKSTAEKWLEEVGLSSSCAIVDHEMEIITGLGLTTTPAVLGIKDGTFLFASSVPSHLALMRILQAGFEAIEKGVTNG